MNLLTILGFGATGWGGVLLAATLMTLAVTVAALAIGAAIGALVAWAKLSRAIGWRMLGDAYTTVFRGVPELLSWLAARATALRASGELTKRRQAQLERAFSASLSRELLLRVAQDERARALLPGLETAVKLGNLLPTAAARRLADAVFETSR